MNVLQVNRGDYSWKRLAVNIRDALSDCEVVVVRNVGIQDPALAGQDLTELFGHVGRLWTTNDELAKEKFYQLPGSPAIIVLSHDGLLGSKKLRMHSDLSHHPSRPYPCRALYAHQIPTDGSATTSFYSCYRFAEMLREDGLLDTFRQYICWHVPAYETGWAGRWNRLIELDPISGREWVAYDDAFIKRIARIGSKNIPLEGDDFETMKDHLNMYRNRLVPYTHHWEPGDIVIWNNRGVLHSRTEVGPDQKRQMYRITFDL